jgi:hypothetical protein
VGALGVLAWALLAYKQSGLQSEVKESVLLTAKTSAMVCWLFVGSAIFSAAFALLGGQDLVEKWVMSMNLTKTEFLILSQVIIFILGWPLEWTEIPQRGEPAACHAQPDLCGDAALHGHPGDRDRAALQLPGHRDVAAASALRPLTLGRRTCRQSALLGRFVFQVTRIGPESGRLGYIDVT